MSNPEKAVSPVDEFIKVFYEMSARYGRSELWYDYIDMHAIALANTCDLRCRDTREEQYNAIVQKYDFSTKISFFRPEWQIPVRFLPKYLPIERYFLP